MPLSLSRRSSTTPDGENTFGLMMSLNMLIEFGDAFDFSGADFRQWCGAAGFRSFDVIPWPAGQALPSLTSESHPIMRAHSSVAHELSICGHQPRGYGESTYESSRWGALRQRRNLALFLASQVTSHSGAWLQFVALAWLAAELTGSGARPGLDRRRRFRSAARVGPVTGALADRADKHRLLIATQLLVVGQGVALGALIITGATSLAVLYGLALVFGVLHAVENPVRRAFWLSWSARDDISRAVSLNGAITATAVSWAPPPRAR